MQAAARAQYGKDGAIHEARWREEGEGCNWGGVLVHVKERECAAHGVADDVSGHEGQAKVLEQSLQLKKVGGSVVRVGRFGKATPQEVIAEHAVTCGYQCSGQPVEVEVITTDSMDTEDERLIMAAFEDVVGARRCELSRGLPCETFFHC